MSAREHILVEVGRGDGIECTHSVDAAVVDASGRVDTAWGDVERPIFPRSAIKLVQALPLVETGAAERYGLGTVELALACASHGGEPRHIAAVRAFLARADLGEDDLECGPAAPMHEPTQRALVAAGEEPARPLHNNCSGKHAGMLLGAKAMGEPTAGYIAPGHPVQRRIAAAIAEMADCDLTQSVWAVDGCGVPTISLPLHALAMAAARIADPQLLAPARRRAVEHLARAMTGEPFMVAGHERLCTEVMEASHGAILAKTGAEGVFVAAIPGLKRGLALKVRDGARRAAGVALVSILDRIGALEDEARQRLARHLDPPITNWSGREVGRIRAIAP